MRLYRNIWSICSHVYRRHRDALGLEIFPDSDDMTPSVRPTTGEEGTPSSILPVIDDDGHDSVHDVAPVLTVRRSDSGPSSLTTIAANFLLHLQEGRRVSQVALTDVIDRCNVMCTHIVNDIKQEIREKCAQAKVDIDSIEGLEDVLSRQPRILLKVLKPSIDSKNTVPTTCAIS